MPVPFPDDDVDLSRPGAVETAHQTAGVLSATRPPGGNTEYQQLLIVATFEAHYRTDPTVNRTST